MPFADPIFGIPSWLDVIIRIVVVVLVMTLYVVYMTYGERKLVARFQLRKGPTKTGPAGLWQGWADTLKLVTKEDLRPANADRWVFELAPYLTFTPVLMVLIALPWASDWGVRNLGIGMFYVFAVLGLNIVGIMMAGLGSGNKYALLGGVRAAAQMISYEIPLVLSMLSVAMITGAQTESGNGTLDLNLIAAMQEDRPFIVLQPLAFVIFFTAMLSELHRAPFDIPVAESEIVGGYSVEYSGIRWSLFQLTEYASMLAFSIFGSVIFLGGWAWPFGEDWGWGWQLGLTVIKAFLFILAIIWVRVTVPRLRIDQLMSFCWKVLLPMALLQMLMNGIILMYEWPQELLSLTSALGAAALVAIIMRRAMTRPSVEGLKGSYRTLGDGFAMKGILKGLGVTFNAFISRPITVEYPDTKHVLPVRQRSFPVLTWDFDHDEPFCTGCNVCVRNCPVDCMTAQMRDNPKYTEGTSNRRKIVEKFWIDYARCMRCNICVEVCPFEAIVMDNTWAGHEHASFDRRDLHMDIDELTKVSRTGSLVRPFRPQDNIEAIERSVKGGPPEATFVGARPEDRRRQEERLAQGLPAAIQEREPEVKQAVAKAAAGAAAGAGEAVEALSESKIRAKRMRAEREAKEFTDRGEAVPQEVLDRIALYSNMKPGVATAAGGAAGGGTGVLLTGLNDDGSMRFPPGVGDGPKGDPNSAEKVRARRMRSERQFKELTAAGEPIPEELAKTLYDLGSDLAPGGSIWAALAGSGGGGGAAAAPLTGTQPDGSMRFPPGVGDGPKGDPNSAEKVRARRMRSERQFKELTAAGEPIPDELAKTLYDLGSDLAPGGSIWATLAGSSGSGGGAAPAGGPAPDADGWVPPPGYGTGPKGDPNSYEKVRARRMRAEKKAREALEKGEAIPDDVLATIKELNGTVPGGNG